MDKQTQHWIAYWQRSLRDESILATAPTYGQGTWISFDALRNNELPIRSKTKRQSVLVSPWTYGAIGMKPPRPVPVLWIAAWLTKGKLSPDTRVLPWINHRLLAPLDEPLLPADLLSAQAHAATIAWTETATWSEWLDLALTLLPEGWQSILQDSGFDPLPQPSCILPRDQPALNKALATSFAPAVPDTPLLRRFFLRSPGPYTIPTPDMVSPLGHYADLPLSPGQRIALAGTTSLAEGDIFALHAPQGTGKTAVIQDTWASLWIQAALTDQRPPVFLVTSTNPQSLFHSLTDLRQQSVFPRWVKDGIDEIMPEETDLFIDDGPFTPDPDAKKAEAIPHEFLAVLLTNDSAKAQAATFTNLSAHTSAGPDGFWTKMETAEYLEQAVERFLACTRSASEEDCQPPAIHSLSDAFAWINHQLHALYKGYRRITALFQEAQHCPNRTPLHTSDSLQIERELAHAQAAHQQSRHLLTDWEIRVRQTHRLSFFDRLTGLTAKSEQTDYLAKRIPRLLPLFTSLGESGFTQALLADVRQCEQRCQELQTLTEEVRRAIFLSGSLRAALTKSCTDSAWSRWIQIEEPQTPPYPESPTDTRWQDWLDRTWRRALLAACTHYWECRWLIEMQEGPSKDARTLWQRRSMLVPVHYAVLSSIPEFFSLDDPKQPPVDYLLIQDAQLARPKTAYPALRVARRLLAIGDLQQPSLFRYGTKSLDNANLQDFALPEEGPESRFRTLDGNILALAQEHCRMGDIADEPEYPRLTEHRYATPAIVAACNDLAYHGALHAQRQEPAPAPFPTLGYYPVQGSSQCLPTGNRRNLSQAEAVAGWVRQNQEKIRSHYGVDGIYPSGTDPLTAILLVLTPFSLQAAAIREAFSRVHLQIRCGTVQSFQGRAAPVVLFSPAYGPDESGPFLFDRYPQILTAALTRAQDAFLIFGGPAGSPQTSWGKLLARTTNIPSAEILPFPDEYLPATLLPSHG